MGESLEKSQLQPTALADEWQEDDVALAMAAAHELINRGETEDETRKRALKVHARFVEAAQFYRQALMKWKDPRTCVPMPLRCLVICTLQLRDHQSSPTLPTQPPLPLCVCILFEHVFIRPLRPSRAHPATNQAVLRSPRLCGEGPGGIPNFREIVLHSGRASLALGGS